MRMAEEHPTVSTVRMREGHAIGEVDAYLDRLPEGLRRRQDPALALIALVVVVLLVLVR